VRRAISLVEVLVVVGILAVLAGLLFPVFKHAKRSAQITDEANRLHQIHLALSLYRTNHDGDGVFGNIYSMGLPDVDMLSKLAIAEEPPFRPISIFASACGVHPHIGDVYGGVEYMPNPSPEWAESARVFRDSLILYCDITCNDADVFPQNPLQTKFAIGVFLSGSIARVRKQGDHSDPAWWVSPPAQ